MTLFSNSNQIFVQKISLTFPDQALHFFQIPWLSLTFQTFGDFGMIFPDFPVCIHPGLIEVLAIHTYWLLLWNDFDFIVMYVPKWLNFEALVISKVLITINLHILADIHEWLWLDTLRGVNDLPTFLKIKIFEKITDQFLSGSLVWKGS